MKRDEIANQLITNRVNVGKVGGRFTECGSACDRSRLFSNTKHDQKRETTAQTNTSLREATVKAMDVLKSRKLLNMSATKREAIIDCTSSDNIINDKSCKSRLTIQDGFLATGETSKSLDGKGINSCPDSHAMINCTKNNDVLINVKDFIDKTHKTSKLCTIQGECTELQRGTVLKIDTCTASIQRELNFTCNQLHLMRSIVSCHF